MSARTVWMFSGQGSQYYQMGKALFEHHTVFRYWMMTLDSHIQSVTGNSVVEAIYSADKTTIFDRTLLTHPAIFIIEYALAQSLRAEGLKPDLVLGTSLGSICAAVVGGYISVEDALAVVLRQAEVFEAHCEPGGMLAILAAPTLFQQDFLSDKSEIASVNFDGHFVVSADQANLLAIEQCLRLKGVINQRIAVSFAFHSHWIDDAAPYLVQPVSFLRPPQGTLPLVCCASGEILNHLPDDFFWQVVRQPIRFHETISNLERSGTCRYIDVGPSGTLATFVKYCLSGDSRSTVHPVLTLYGRDMDNLSSLLNIM